MRYVLARTVHEFPNLTIPAIYQAMELWTDDMKKAAGRLEKALRGTEYDGRIDESISAYATANLTSPDRFDRRIKFLAFFNSFSWSHLPTKLAHYLYSR